MPFTSLFEALEYSQGQQNQTWHRRYSHRCRTVVLGLMMSQFASAIFAQSPPAVTAPASGDTPSIRVGTVIYADYSYTATPRSIDTDGNPFNPSAFNVGRAYLNVTGELSRLVAFRITPDVARETGAGSSLNGSLNMRIKYAYAQFKLDDWMTRGSYARLGIQQTPWLDYAEGIYRYRFQGTMFVERAGYFASADAGAGFHYNFPADYGDVHVGIFNGENYNKPEANNRKALMIRGALRPLPKKPVVQGFRVSAFWDDDSYVKNGKRTRFIGNVTFEHKYLNASLEYLRTNDQVSVTRSNVEGKGYSIWATPKLPNGWEALLRYDHLTPDTALRSQIRNRTILGIAYWFPHQGSVSSALLLDYEGTTPHNFDPAQPKQRRVALHGLISF